MKQIRKLASFLRWRLVPIRYLTMLRHMRWRRLIIRSPSVSSISFEIEEFGYHVTTPVDKDVIEKIRAIYSPRTASVIPNEYGHPFANLFNEDDIHPENPVLQTVFSPKILNAAADYFGNKLILDSIQVLYSYSTAGEIRESQYWHLDYGDRKSFHAITYLNDIRSGEDGPFVFVDKRATQKIGRSLIIRRIADEHFTKKLGDESVINFLGAAGSTVFVDPAACYHYGSRCKFSRLALFTTFSGWFPYAQPMPIISDNKKKFYKVAKYLRPDLNSNFLKIILQI